MVGFGSTKPTLFVGPSAGMNNTGKVGIGNVTDPQAKLHIKADQNETAALFIEPYLWGGNYNAYLFLGTLEYGLRAVYGKLIFRTAPDGAFVFDSGNVGIGTVNPAADLDVDGLIRTTSLRLASGQQAAGYLLRSDADGNADWVDPAGLLTSPWSQSGDNVYRTQGNIGIGTDNPSSKLQVEGDIYLSQPGSGIILRSPDQQCWQLTIDNSGQLSVISVDCVTKVIPQTMGSINDKFIIYPNPARDELCIKVQDLPAGEAYTAEVCSPGGIVLLKEEGLGDNATLDLSRQGKGWYILRITFLKETAAWKFLRE